jgi:hypothetical protein
MPLSLFNYQFEPGNGEIEGSILPILQFLTFILPSEADENHLPRQLRWNGCSPYSTKTQLARIGIGFRAHSWIPYEISQGQFSIGNWQIMALRGTTPRQFRAHWCLQG